ncbi:protein ILRUN isoform X1 [Dendrobates tinctorius]|uniref:protein ILRUN isoform X1 n=1 Tax=Dendrobates tinctorius TaxID=92724 RepID=UPI003CCA3433
MESVKTAIPLIGPSYFMATIDLKDAYFHIPIHPSHRKYLRFAIQQGPEIRHFQYNVLPFGISSAPRVFSKIMTEAVPHIRSQGICIVPYMDDLLVIGASYKTLEHQVAQTLDILQSLEWIPNIKKSQIQPSQVVKFLGILLDSKNQMFFLPEEHQRSIISRVSKFREQRSPTLGSAMSILGSMTSCIQSVPWAQAHSRKLQSHILSNWNWGHTSLNKRVQTPGAVKASLAWWMDHKNLCKGINWSQTPLVTVTTDASKKGWGAVVSRHPFQGLWSQKVSAGSSNFRELKAVEGALLAAKHLVQGHHIRVYSDNITTVAHLRHQGGTRSSNLESLSSRIFCWAEKHLSSLTAIHLRGTANLQADFLSRKRIQPGERTINKRIFQKLVNRWGLPEVDLLASGENTQLRNYFSLNPKDRSLGCFRPQMEVPSSICLPASSNSCCNPEKDPGGSNSNHPSSSTMAKEELVLSNHRATGRPAIYPTHGGRPSLARPSASPEPQGNEVSGLATEAQILRTSGLSEEVIKTLQKSRKPLTIAIYYKIWKKFSSWCLPDLSDPENHNISRILDFLQRGLELGLKPSTLKVQV